MRLASARWRWSAYRNLGELQLLERAADRGYLEPVTSYFIKIFIAAIEPNCVDSVT